MKRSEKESRLTIREIGLEARLTLQESGRVVEGIIDKAASHGNKLVLNMGEAGQLVIEKAGKALIVSGTEILKKAFEGGQATLKVAGLEARLTIQEAGIELRSIITHAGKEFHAISYEMPRLSRLAAESFARGLKKELEDAIWEPTPLKVVERAMQNYMGEHPQANLEALLKYVHDQNHLAPKDKAQLYVKLIQFVNMPGNEEERQKIIIIIATVAFNDEKLYEQIDWQITSYTRNYTQSILDAIPNKEVKKAFIERNENELLSYFGLLPAPSIEPDGSVPIGAILPFSSHIVPADYVECDGGEYSISDFPDLYEVIGNRYSYGTASEGKFKVPDYRGYFLRGWEHNQDETRENLRLGEVQEDSTRMPRQPFKVEPAGKHTHEINTAGKHKHKVRAAGEHKHTATDAGEHMHALASDGEHYHKMENIGNHAHTILKAGHHSHHQDHSGEHAHGMGSAGEHTHGIHRDGQSAPRSDMGSLSVQGVQGAMMNTHELGNTAGSHTHSIHNAGSHTHVLHYGGEHTHTAQAEGAHVHSVYNAGVHTHTVESSENHTHPLSSAGGHEHPIEEAPSHTHEMQAAGKHAHILTGGDTETRPKNIQVKYMIKYKSPALNLHQKIKDLEQKLTETFVKMEEKDQTNFLYTTILATFVFAATIPNLLLTYCRKGPSAQRQA